MMDGEDKTIDDGDTSIDDQNDLIDVFRFLEDAQGKNFRQTEEDLFLPKKPWKTQEEYKKAQDEYKNQLKKSEMIADCVSNEEEKMIENKLKEGIQGKIIEEDDEHIDHPNEESTHEGDNGDPTEASDMRKQDESIIQITNLPKETQKKDLFYLLASFGPVSEIYLAKDTTSNTSEGFAVITFKDKKDAQNAIEGLSGMGYDLLILEN